jgi:hypothetical protein
MTPDPDSYCSGDGQHWIVYDFGMRRYHVRHAEDSDIGGILPCIDYVVLSQSSDGDTAGYLVNLGPDESPGAKLGPWDVFNAAGKWIGIAQTPEYGASVIDLFIVGIGVRMVRRGAD